MYSVEYLPVVKFSELREAVQESFNKVLKVEELIGNDVEKNVYYPYHIIPVKELVNHSPEKAIVSIMVSEVLNKYFRTCKDTILISVE